MENPQKELAGIALGKNSLIASLEVPPRISRHITYIQADVDSYIVKDAQTGRYFRLSSRTVDIMKNLDGTQTPAGLSTKLHIPSTAIQYVIDQLATQRLLDGYVPVDNTQQNWLKRCNDLLLIRKDFVTSDVWIEKVYRTLQLKYVFRPWLLFVLLCFYIVGSSMYIRYSNILGAVLEQLLSGKINLVSYIVPFMLILIISTTLHELAHGFVCKHFGGKVRSIGVAIYYFRPAFYCDVTDTWTFRKRYQRFFTHAAGLMMNFWLCSLGALLLPWSFHNPWLQVFLTINFFISGISALVNLNPFIRLDGYYMLADVLKINNLRSASFNVFYSMLCALFCKLHFMKNQLSSQKKQYTWHIQCILLVYAPLSCGYLIFLAWLLGESYTHFLPGVNTAWSWALCGVFLILFLGLPSWRNWHEQRQRTQRLQKFVTEKRS